MAKGSSEPSPKRRKPNPASTLDAFLGRKPAAPSSAVVDLVSSDEDECRIVDRPEPSRPKLTPRAAAKVEADVKPSPRSPKAPAKPAALVVPAAEYPALESDILDFVPSRDIDISTWPRGKDGAIQVPYALLTAAFVVISTTKSRLIIGKVLTNMYRSIVAFEPLALLAAVYLVTNHLGPSYEGIELGLGGSIVSKTVKEVSGISPHEAKRLWDRYGDAGDVAFHAKSNIRTLLPSPPLLVSGVYSTLKRIAGLRGGAGVGAQKQALCTKLLVAARGEETRFLVRTFVSHLRIGAVRLTNTAALARAFCLTRADGRDEADDRADSFWIGVGEREGVRAIDKKPKDVAKRARILAVFARAEALVRAVFVKHPNYSHIVPALLDPAIGLDGLAEAVPLAIGTPLNPMLGQITRDLADVAHRIGGDEAEFAAEWKVDGQRVQIHARRRRPDEKPVIEAREPGTTACGGKWVGPDRTIYVRLYSRHLVDMTDKYPDILALVPLLMTDGVDSFIADAEVGAIDPSGGLLSFQTLSNRARKDVQIDAVSVRVCVFAFDLMYLNGESLLAKPFRHRRDLLKSRFPPLSTDDLTIARFDHVKSLIGTAADLEPVREFMNEAISNKCEGLMLKILDDQIIEPVAASPVVKDEGDDDDDVDLMSDDDDEPDKKAKATPSKRGKRRKALLASYEPDKRVDSWLKVKRDYGALGDSFDLVPVGAWHGMGRKATWWSPVLLAAYDPQTDSFKAVCKVISGLPDALYLALNERYPKDSPTCSSTTKLAELDTGGLRPDVWFRPSEIWECRGADITLSPVYPVAQGLIPGSNRGCSIRFPRVIRVRDDKTIEQATTPHDLAAAYERQESRGQDGGKGAAAKTPVRSREAGGSGSGEDEDDADEDELLDVMDD